MKYALKQSLRSPLRIAGAYCVFGVLWILLSDHLVALANLNATAASMVQSVKGIAYVVISTLLIGFMARRELRSVAQNSELLTAVAEGTNDAVFVKDRDGRYLLVNSAAGFFMNEDTALIIGKTDYDFFDRPSAQGIRENDQWVMDHQRIKTYRETLTASGVTRIFFCTKAPHFNEKRQVIGVVGISRDITEQMAVENKLRESEQRFRSIVETTSEWIWATDIKGNHTMSNPAVLQILGYPADKFLGNDGTWAMHPSDRDSLNRITKQCVAEKRGWNNMVIRWRHQDGSYRWLESTAVPVLSESGDLQGYYGADRDVTQRINLEEQLRHAQKMEAVGQLAGGIAHDFNNLLTVINGYSEMLLASATAAPSAEPVPASAAAVKTGNLMLAGIADAGKRAAGLTRQLLAFSRKQVLELRVVDLNQTIFEMENLLRPLIGEAVELHLQLGADLPPVRVDVSQMTQVLTNLSVNARDAMPNGGRLIIQTKEVMVDLEVDGEMGKLKSGPHLLMTVTDTGMGINPDLIPHLFEPFFTTKKVGKGTGLGLAVVHGIIQQSGGHIAVDTVPGHGTTFRIYLPVASDAVIAPRDSAAPDVSYRGNETILLVEDDDGVREFAALALEEQGYKVLKANGPEQAIELATIHQSAIALLMTDVVMPGMNGPQLAKAIRRLCPGIPVLIASGYSAEPVIANGHDRESFIAKPYTSNGMTRKIRAMLDRK